MNVFFYDVLGGGSLERRVGLLFLDNMSCLFVTVWVKALTTVRKV
jgi:hypothetical protein